MNIRKGLSASTLLSFPLMAISLSTSADCSHSIFGGDPTGILTNTIAFNVVNSNPPPATFLLSDISEKGVTLPSGPGPSIVLGTPFDDYLMVPHGSFAAGLNAGSDVFLLADRQQSRPGINEVDVMEGGVENNGGDIDSLFILGDSKKRYYVGKDSIYSADRDYAYINRFALGKAKIRLHGKASDYRLTWISGLFAKALSGTAIVTKDTCDLVGFVRGKLLNTLGGENF